MNAPSSTDSPATESASSVPGDSPAVGATGIGARLAGRLGLIRYSAAYGLVILVVIFSILEPGLFLTQSNLNLILVDSAVTGIIAIGVLVPLVAGLLDLSFAGVAGFGSVLMTWLTLQMHVNSFLLAAVTVIACALFGVASGLLVALFNLDSLIVTLGMSSVALGLTQFITNGNTMTGRFDSSFETVGLKSYGIFPLLAIIFFVLALVVYVWLEHTPGGRFVIATGSNVVAARLTGIRVAKTQVLTLGFSSLIAGLGGVLLVARIGSVSDTTGQSYLLPVVAALFLGTTQILPRANVWGTVLAVYLLGTGIQGIELEGNAPWVSSLFNGLVLLIAVSIGTLRFRQRRIARRTPQRASTQSSSTRQPD